VTYLTLNFDRESYFFVFFATKNWLNLTAADQIPMRFYFYTVIYFSSSLFCTNFTIGEKFQKFIMRIYNLMELYGFQDELLILSYKPTIPPRQ